MTRQQKREAEREAERNFAYYETGAGSWIREYIEVEAEEKRRENEILRQEADADFNEFKMERS